MNRWTAWLLDLPHEDVAGVDAWYVRFTGLGESLWLLLAVLAAFAALAWVVVRSYRREGAAGGGVRSVLMSLRLATLLVLLLVALQPALVLQSIEYRRGHVVVLVDDSLSMRWVDSYTDDSQRRAIAEFLNTEPEALDDADAPMRIDLVRHALGRAGGAVAELAQRHPLHLVRFAVNDPASSAYIEPLLAMPHRSEGGAAAVAEMMGGAAAGLEAAGHQTDLGRAVRETLTRFEGRHLAGLVVVSDGQNTAAGQVQRRLEAAAELAVRRGVPIYTVAVGDPTPPRNIALVRLDGPTELRAGSAATYTAVLSHRGYDGQSVDVRLLYSEVGEDDWQPLAPPLPARLDAAEPGEAEPLQEVSFTATAPPVGEYVFRAEVEPRPDERIRDDNHADLPVRISDERITVLLIGGHASWEFQYLRNMLLRDTDHYEVSVWQQNADPRFNQEASTGLRRAALPRSADDLFIYDVVVLFDPRPEAESFDEQFIELLEKFVSRHHGGLCYIAGGKYTGDNLTDGGALSRLAELLPVVLRGRDGTFTRPMRPSRSAAPVELAPDGWDHPVTRLAPEPDDSEAQWARLPGLYSSFPVARLKSLATPLLLSGDDMRQTEDGRRQPVAAVQYYGRGRVLFMGIDSTWRWRRIDRGQVHQQFWMNAVDFLAAGRLDRKRLVVTTAGPRYDAGSPVRVRLEAYQRDFTPISTEQFTLGMVDLADRGITEHTLRAVRPGFYEGVLLADRTGRFDLVPLADGEGNTDWVEEDVAPRRIEIELPQAELQRPEADYETLALLAGDPRRALMIHQFDTLSERIPDQPQRRVTESMHLLWNTMSALLLLGVLLLTEWTVRKVHNMM